MQSLILKIQSAVAGNVGLTLGYLLIGALAAQVLLLLVNSIRRAWVEGRQQRLARQRLELQVETAKAQLREASQIELHWNGYRKFRVKQKVLECADVYSFYLAPHDGKPLPAFKPGQYVTFQLAVPGRDKPLIRCYSLSDSPNNPGYYRVTIKRATAPPDKPEAPAGVVSSFFCDSVHEGDILDVKAPSGNFCIDVHKPTGVALVSAGVGITPMLSMAKAILESGSKREVWFFLGARNRHDHIQKTHLEQLAAAHDNFHLHVHYSRPEAADQLGKDYHQSGRLDMAAIKNLLPSTNYEFYLCGPGAFMKSLTDGLESWGVPDSSVFFEAFGPATVKRAAPAVTAAAATATALQVTFSRSHKICQWRPDFGSLLDLAEEQGIKIESGCRSGSCGTCLVAIKVGTVDYLTEHGADAEAGSCLTCICKPKTNLVLDA